MKLALLCCLSLSVLVTLHFRSYAEEETPERAIWVTIDDSAAGTKEKEKLVLQVSEGVDVELVDSIAECVSGLKTNPLQFESTPTSQLSLTFRSNSFRVIKVNGDTAMSTPGKTFPFAATREVAQQLKTYGINQTSIFSPNMLSAAPGTSRPFDRTTRFRLIAFAP